MKQHVAVAGTGYWGKNLVRVFGRLGVLGAVCDSDQNRFAGLELPGEVRRYTDFNRLLGDGAIDAIVIATPAATHYDLCRQALESGRDVMVEKPLALTVEQGRELVTLAEQGGRVLMVGHILRYHPAVGKLAEMIADGDLGRVEYIYSNRLNMGKLRTEENILWSFAPHDISVILALLAERPVLVSSHGEAFLQRNISDVTLTAIDFPNGVKAHTFVSWLHPFKEQRLVVVGSEQMAVFEDSRPQEKLVRYPHWVQWHAGKVPVAMKGERKVVEIPEAEPLKVECEHFLESCGTRIPPRTDGHEGLAVLEVLAAAEASLKQGGEPVPLPAPTNGRVKKAASDQVSVTSLRQYSRAAVREPVGVAVAAEPAVSTEKPSPQPQASNPGLQAQARAAAPDSLRSVSPSLVPVPQPPTPVFFAHPTAVVDEGAEIGAGSKVWHYTHISGSTRIGRKNVLGQNVFVAEGVTTGDNCKVQNNVSLYKGVVMEDDVFCGPSCVFTNVVDPRAFLEKKSEFRPTLVKQGASIGANATVVCGRTLGRYCLVGSGAVVTHDVPDYALMTGVPARQTGWVCRCGERLRFADREPDSTQRHKDTIELRTPAAQAAACEKCGERYELSNGQVRPAGAAPEKESNPQITQTCPERSEGSRPSHRRDSSENLGMTVSLPSAKSADERSRSTPIPMLDLKREYQYMKSDIDQAIERALEHQGWIMGPEVKDFETRIARYVGTKHAVGCASGTDALVLALRALAFKRTGKECFTRDDEIITTPFTFTATGDAILRAGATPVFVDIEPESFNIDPDKVRAAVNERTVGILPVHLYGQVCSMDELLAIAREHGLFVVEDCAQSFGATEKVETARGSTAQTEGRKCGSMGDAGAFSFFPSKNLGGFGDAGMVTTNDPELARTCDMLRRHGGKDKYNVDQLGYNSRLDTLQAAVLLAKLRYVDAFNDRRKKVAAQYNLALGSLPGAALPTLPRNGEHVFHQYTIRVRDRDRVAARLKERGVASMVYYPVPLHKMKVFAGRSRCAGLPAEAERAAAEVLSLPIEPLLSNDEIQAVNAAVKDAWNKE